MRNSGERVRRIEQGEGRNQILRHGGRQGASHVDAAELHAGPEIIEPAQLRRREYLDPDRAVGLLLDQLGKLERSKMDRMRRRILMAKSQRDLRVTRLRHSQQTSGDDRRRRNYV